MDETLVAHAIRLTRTTVGAGEDVPARADVVRRLDRPGEYVLVVLGDVPGTLEEPLAREALALAAAKLPVRSKFVKREER